MRGKKAKAIRRKVERMTVGLPLVRYAKKNGGRILIHCTRAYYQAHKAAAR